MTIDQVDAVLDELKGKILNHVAIDPQMYGSIAIEVNLEKGRITAGQVESRSTCRFQQRKPPRRQQPPR